MNKYLSCNCTKNLTNVPMIAFALTITRSAPQSLPPHLSLTRAQYLPTLSIQKYTPNISRHQSLSSKSCILFSRAGKVGILVTDSARSRSDKSVNWRAIMQTRGPSSETILEPCFFLASAFPLMRAA